MKKLLLALSIMLMSLSTAQAGSQQALRHANPMPNLMRIAIKNASILGVTPEQMKNLQVWVKKSKPEMIKMVQQVRSEEKMLLENALTIDKDVVKKSETVLGLRKKIIEMKTNCRAVLKNTLTEKQYANVINIYRSVR